MKLVFQYNSRYYRIGEYVIKDTNGNPVKVKKVRQFDKAEKALTYVVKDGDRLDLLAYKFFGDATKFWLICDANSIMFPPDLLVPGNTIIIPKEGV